MGCVLGQAAFFAPDGSGRLATTCYDDLVRIWTPSKDKASAHTQWGGKGGGTGHLSTAIKHNNQTGRWVLPFRAVWAPGSDGVVVGSMKVREC